MTLATDQEVVDDEGVETLVAELGRIATCRAALERGDSPTRLDDLDELDAMACQIRDRLEQDQGLGGRRRKLGDERERIRKRVCAAITRALKEFGVYDKPLAAHLTKPILSLGHTISYIPREGETWTVIQ